MKAQNPLAFRPLPVVVIVTIVYLVFSVGLLYVGTTVPHAPRHNEPVKGLDLSQAFADLQELTKTFHPYNSRFNDHVRSWLLTRVGNIFDENDIDHATVQMPDEGPPKAISDAGNARAVIFNDLQSNASFTAIRFTGPGLSTYFEGTNVIVYVRGTDDTPGAWWSTGQAYSGPKGVLVNAHYDSVSTGYGATDDGVGVISILQLINFFSTKGNQPKHGILFLFNNGEEDFLNGARAFTQNPVSSFADRFLNLEGAGAGGRAALFRSTDTEITRYYQHAKYPFATSVSDDGFKAGLIKSETDYRIFFGDLGMRGLDVAFLEPRSRYHTVEDDSRHTGRDSLWHMLSAALPVTRALVSSELDADKRTDAAWFDLFGQSFAVLELHALFALQVTLLVLAPISIIVLLVMLHRKDKLYLLSRYRFIGDAKARMGGLKGLFRAPIIFAVSSGSTVALAFLLIKFNAFIALSSPWAVWACFTSLWVFSAWFFSRFADYVRPTALHRVYTLLWLHLGTWILGVGAAVYENQGLSSPYPILFYQLGFWLATLFALAELFVITRQSTFAKEQLGLPDEPASPSDEPAPGHLDDDDAEPTERTSLLNQETTFRPRSRRTENTMLSAGSYLEGKPANVYRYEQFWSEKLPSTLWVLEFLVSAIPAIIFVGPLITFITSSLTQTLSDGGATGIYLPMAIVAILFVTPIQPYIHRFTYHVPIFLLFVFTGTLIYNLSAFPFSANNRLKLMFVQQVDLDTGLNHVVLTGASKKYMKLAIAELPSAAGQHIHYQESARPGMIDARWSGDAPTVVLPPPGKQMHAEHDGLSPPPEYAYENWLSVNVSHPATLPDGDGRRTANITVLGRNTRNCKLLFDDAPVVSFHVAGSTWETEPYGGNGGIPEGQTTGEIRLWHRDWDQPWTVQVTWKGDERKGLDGMAVCMWNEDESQAGGGIPALQEVWHYAPTWIAVTKTGDGLVEGSKRFLI